MTREITLGKRLVGEGHPTYIVAEIGINHNGSLETARQLIAAAKHAGVDAVKFQSARQSCASRSINATKCATRLGAISLTSNTATRLSSIKPLTKKLTAIAASSA